MNYLTKGLQIVSVIVQKYHAVAILLRKIKYSEWSRIKKRQEAKNIVFEKYYPQIPKFMSIGKQLKMVRHGKFFNEMGKSSLFSNLFLSCGMLFVWGAYQWFFCNKIREAPWWKMLRQTITLKSNNWDIFWVFYDDRKSHLMTLSRLLGNTFWLVSIFFCSRGSFWEDVARMGTRMQGNDWPLGCR